MHRVQWIHLVIMVFTSGPMFLSSTALQWKILNQTSSLCKNVSHIFKQKCREFSVNASTQFQCSYDTSASNPLWFLTKMRCIKLHTHSFNGLVQGNMDTWQPLRLSSHSCAEREPVEITGAHVSQARCSCHTTNSVNALKGTQTTKPNPRTSPLVSPFSIHQMTTVAFYANSPMPAPLGSMNMRR